MVNLSPYIATDPEMFFMWFRNLDLDQRYIHVRQAVEIMLAQCRHADLVVAAWGKWKLPDDGYPDAVRRELSEAGVTLHTFGLNQDGSPRHPMARGKHRLPADVEPQVWPL